MGSFPSFFNRLSKAFTCKTSCPLSSTAPRAYKFPFSLPSAQHGWRHPTPSSGSGGWHIVMRVAPAPSVSQQHAASPHTPADVPLRITSTCPCRCALNPPRPTPRPSPHRPYASGVVDTDGIRNSVFRSSSEYRAAFSRRIPTAPALIPSLIVSRQESIGSRFLSRWSNNGSTERNAMPLVEKRTSNQLRASKREVSTSAGPRQRWRQRQRLHPESASDAPSAPSPISGTSTDPKQWQAFMESLDRPVRKMPRLERLDAGALHP